MNLKELVHKLLPYLQFTSKKLYDYRREVKKKTKKKKSKPYLLSQEVAVYSDLVFPRRSVARGSIFTYVSLYVCCRSVPLGSLRYARCSGF